MFIPHCLVSQGHFLAAIIREGRRPQQPDRHHPLSCMCCDVVLCESVFFVSGFDQVKLQDRQD